MHTLLDLTHPVLIDLACRELEIWYMITLSPIYRRFTAAERRRICTEHVTTTVDRYGNTKRMIGEELHSPDGEWSEEILPRKDNQRELYYGRIWCTTKTAGIHAWHKNGELHRDDDLPAVVISDGTRLWYRHGDLHRDGDQPAIEWCNGTLHWYHNGRHHRDGDQPAMINNLGDRSWWRRGLPHRDDGKVAYIQFNGAMQWYRNGELHREDGPAHITVDGECTWYLDGIKQPSTGKNS